jgi:hypothetical protein
MTDARARIHAMFPLDEAATAELDQRLDNLIVEALIKAGVQYVDCPACGAAHRPGGECGTCAFKARMAAELAARGMAAPVEEKATAEAATATPDTLANWLYLRLDNLIAESSAAALREAADLAGQRTGSPADQRVLLDFATQLRREARTREGGARG